MLVQRLQELRADVVDGGGCEAVVVRGLQARRALEEIQLSVVESYTLIKMSITSYLTQLTILFHFGNNIPAKHRPILVLFHDTLLAPIHACELI